MQVLFPPSLLRIRSIVILAAAAAVGLFTESVGVVGGQAILQDYGRFQGKKGLTIVGFDPFTSIHRNAEVKAAAQYPFLYGRNVHASVFFKHMRKAGGTTMVDGLLKPLAKQLRATRNVTLTIHHQEFATFPPMCLNLTASMHVFVVTLREPVARLKSLFYYNGIGKEPHHPSQTSALWREWMHQARTNNSVGRHDPYYRYFGNYYTHQLTSTQGCKYEAQRSTQGTCGTNPNGKFNFVTPGCRVNFPLRQGMYEVAIIVLRAFDLVVLVEEMFTNKTLARVRAVLGVDLSSTGGGRDDLHFAKLRKHHQLNDKHSNLRPDPDPGVMREIREDNAVDIRLYNEVASWW